MKAVSIRHGPVMALGVVAVGPALFGRLIAGLPSLSGVAVTAASPVSTLRT